MHRAASTASSSSSAAALAVAWKALAAGGSDRHAPSPRQGHSATAVPRRECIVVFGGQGDFVRGTTFRAGGSGGGGASAVGEPDGRKIYYNDCYRFDCKTRAWSSLPCTGDAPSPRAGHTALVVSNTRLVVTGGTNGRRRLCDMYRLNLGFNFADSINN